MELRTLRYLVAVVDSGSVSAAAAVVRVAQPSLSRQIRALEAELGLRLFTRDSGRLTLSAAGTQFLPVARELLNKADAALSVAATLAAGRLDRIRVAAPATTITDVVAPFIATFGPGDPFPSVQAESAQGAYDALAQGAIDLVVSPAPPSTPCTSIRFATFPIWLYVPEDHPWGDREAVDLADLADQPLLLLPDSYIPRRLIDKATSAADVTLRAARETSSPEVAQALAAAGWGYAVVADDSRYGLRGLRIATPDGDLRFHLHAAWHADHHGGAEIARLVARLREFCRTRYPGA